MPRRAKSTTLRAIPVLTARAYFVLVLLAMGGCDGRARHAGAQASSASPSAEPGPAGSTAPSAQPQPAHLEPGPDAAVGDAATVARPSGGLPVLEALGFAITKRYQEKHLPWLQVAELNWQADASELPKLPPEPGLESAGCPAGMVRVRGKMLVDAKGRDDTDGVHVVQDRACSHWRTNGRGLEGQCDTFDAARWRELSKELPRHDVDVCMDRYEFPNTYGEYPLVVVRFIEGENYCKKVGKRLCTESEWTFACEGEEGLPYPYGYVRDKNACTIDILASGAGGDTFKPRTTARTARGVDFAWHGTRSGERAACKSPFGVMDMTGNVDEWTRSVRRYGYRMILKGGHWGPARQRCRPQTRGHGPMYVRYDLGFRCCQDPK
ncbi:MAG: SUMF1/EgtB/PvdO family nonheme iron enzyme [Polyangiaceae bacterium]